MGKIVYEKFLHVKNKIIARNVEGRQLSNDL